jgi:hypothetical protein
LLYKEFIMTGCGQANLGSVMGAYTAPKNANRHQVACTLLLKVRYFGLGQIALLTAHVMHVQGRLTEQPAVRL